MATEAANVTNTSIASYAERLGEHHEIYDENGRADIQEFVTKLGGKLTYADSTESLHVSEPGVFTIFLPQFTSVSRDRFTIAHELGHYFLHYLYKKRTGEASFGRGSRNRAETEANVFASALLMPHEAFERVWRATGADEWRVANHFDVSPAAAGVRAQVLRLS